MTVIPHIELKLADEQFFRSVLTLLIRTAPNTNISDRGFKDLQRDKSEEALSIVNRTLRGAEKR